MSELTDDMRALAKQVPKLKTLWGGLLIAVILANSFHFAQNLAQTKLRRTISPYMFFGFAFSGLDQFLKGVKTIGYYTDRDMDKNENAAVFAQAQFMLAPVLMELNNTDHEFILINCSTESIALAKIKELNAVALKKNNLGVILAKRKL